MLPSTRQEAAAECARTIECTLARTLPPPVSFPTAFSQSALSSHVPENLAYRKESSDYEKKTRDRQPPPTTTDTALPNYTGSRGTKAGATPSGCGTDRLRYISFVRFFLFKAGDILHASDALAVFCREAKCSFKSACKEPFQRRFSSAPTLKARIGSNANSVL